MRKSLLYRRSDADRLSRDPRRASAARNVYTSNYGGTVGIFTADNATGALSPATAASVPRGSSQRGIALTPNGKFLYVADTGGGQVLGYTVCRRGGLTPMAAPFPTAAAPRGSPRRGRQVRLRDERRPNSISGFAVGTNGALTPLPGSPYATGSAGFGIVTTPDAKTVYVTSPAGIVTGWSIGADGSLTALPATPVNAGSSPSPMSIDPSGKFLYVGDYGMAGKIYGFVVSAGGALAPIAGSPFASDPIYGGLAVAPDGKHLYASDEGASKVQAFTVGTDGALAAVAGSPFAAGGAAPTEGIAVTPDSKHVYRSRRSRPGQRLRLHGRRHRRADRGRGLAVLGRQHGWRPRVARRQPEPGAEGQPEGDPAEPGPEGEGPVQGRGLDRQRGRSRATSTTSATATPRPERPRSPRSATSTSRPAPTR